LGESRGPDRILGMSALLAIVLYASTACAAPEGATLFFGFEKGDFALAQGGALLIGGHGPCTYEFHRVGGERIGAVTVKPGRIRWDLQMGSPKALLREGEYDITSPCDAQGEGAHRLSVSYRMPDGSLPVAPEERQKAFRGAVRTTSWFVGVGAVAGLGAGIATWSKLKSDAKACTEGCVPPPTSIVPFVSDGVLGGAAAGLLVGVPVSFGFLRPRALRKAAAGTPPDKLPADVRAQLVAHVKVTAVAK